MCVWIIDADRIKFGDDFYKYIYRNSRVDEFLSESQLGICANKGVGKTFLLKYKRNRFQLKGIFCLPIDAMVDSFTDIDIDYRLRNFFNDYYNWKRLWEMAIFISIANNYEDFKCDYKEFQSSDVMENILFSANLQQSKFSVSSIIQYLLHIPKKS